MSYIGKEPTVGAYHMLDSLTASATTDYTLQLDSVNFVPESANHLIVSLNGVIQKANSSFTVSGSTLSFSSALTSSDSIDFVLALGNVLDIGTPSDGTVSSNKLATSAITGQTAETTVADDDTVLIHDTSASALRKMTVSNLTANAGVAGISSSADATAITIDSSERVGIGTTSPGALLELKHGTNLRLMFDTSIDSLPTIKSFQDTAGRNGLRFDADNINFETNTGNNTPVNRLKVASNGEVAINDDSTATGAPVFKIKGALNNTVGIIQHGTSSSSSETIFLFRDGAVETCGSIGINPNSNSVSYNTSSDYRLKENETIIPDGIDRVKQLKPYRFNFISNPSNTVDGFFAHEVSSIVPEAVQGEKDEMEKYREGENIPEGSSVGDFKLDDEGNQIPKHQQIDQAKLVPLLTKALQEALTKIETLESKVTALENA